MRRSGCPTSRTWDKASRPPNGDSLGGGRGIKSTAVWRADPFRPRKRLCESRIGSKGMLRRTTHPPHVEHLAHSSSSPSCGWLMARSLAPSGTAKRHLDPSPTRGGAGGRQPHRRGPSLAQWKELRDLGETLNTVGRAVERGWVILDSAGSGLQGRSAALTAEGRRLARKGR
jgi:hypothetical protein